jgi:hypothetical protein
LFKASRPSVSSDDRLVHYITGVSTSEFRRGEEDCDIGEIGCSGERYVQLTMPKSICGEIDPYRFE